ncbi:60S ribosomal subunit assembly or modification protein [Batrachochytrium dendrobatidis]|nr:60S ribosomal subunit assembly or modification protein [Batrachochytrium dendrobatidis]KAK5672614.1 60S ribosomal subunit assembly or modification protein [Batrachochytrium dendrobatidis]
MQDTTDTHEIEGQETYLEGDEIDQVIDIEQDNEPMSEDDDALDTAEVDQDTVNASNSMTFTDDSIQGFFEHREPVYAVALHPIDQTIAASGGGDDRSYLWRMDTGEKVYNLATHSDSVIAISFSNDGLYVASGGMDGKVFVFRVSDGHLEQELDGPPEINWLNWHPKGNVILVGGDDGSVWMWRIPSGKCMSVMYGHSGSVTCGQFTPDGKSIVTGSADGTIIVWDPKTSTSLCRFTGDDARFHQTPINTLAIKSDSSLAISAGQDGSVRLLHIGNGRILAALDSHQESVETVDFSDFLPYVSTGSIDGKIHTWDITTLRIRHTVQHDDAVIKLQWHKSMPYFTSCSADMTIRTWDGRSGECLKIWRGHQAPILDFSVRADGRVVLTGSDDGNSLVFQNNMLENTH